jgi:hypothetical protein
VGTNPPGVSEQREKMIETIINLTGASTYDANPLSDLLIQTTGIESVGVINVDAL